MPRVVALSKRTEEKIGLLSLDLTKYYSEESERLQGTAAGFYQNSSKHAWFFQPVGGVVTIRRVGVQGSASAGYVALSVGGVSVQYDVGVNASLVEATPTRILPQSTTPPSVTESNASVTSVDFEFAFGGYEDVTDECELSSSGWSNVAYARDRDFSTFANTSTDGAYLTFVYPQVASKAYVAKVYTLYNSPAGVKWQYSNGGGSWVNFRSHASVSGSFMNCDFINAAHDRIRCWYDEYSSSYLHVFEVRVFIQ